MFKKKPKAKEEGNELPKKKGKFISYGVLIALFAVIFIGVAVAVGFSVDHISRTNPNFCGTCHNMTEHVDSYLNQNHMDNAHYLAGVGCKDCHSDYTVAEEMKSLVSYVSGDYSVPMDKIKTKDDMCLQCHISQESLAEKTDLLFRNPHQGHFTDLRCKTCHVSHGTQVNYCGSCHDNGGQRMVEDPFIPRSENPFAPGNTPNENAPRQ